MHGRKNIKLVVLFVFIERRGQLLGLCDSNGEWMTYEYEVYV